MMGSRVFEVGFLALSALGFTLLWPMMVYNGTLIALLRAAWNGAFADGRPLRTTYICFPPVDFAISVLVAFFDEQIDGSDDGTWLFMFDFQALLQTATLWVLIEANREGQSEWLLKLFFLWPLLWNLFGAAIVLPLYLYFHTRSTNARRANPIVSTARARALIPIMALTGFMPALAMLFGYRFATDFCRQAITASYQFSPLVLAVVVIFISPTASNSSRANGTGNYSDLVRYSYIFAGIVSGSAHLYTLAITLLSIDQDVRFGRVFIPSPSKVIPGSVENIHHGGLLFLQYDWIVVNISCALWVYLFIHTRQIFSDMQGGKIKILLILFFILLLGPGGTVCGALWLREENLKLQYAERQRQ